MKVPEADHRATGEAANTRGEKLVYGFSDDPGAEDDTMALCGVVRVLVSPDCHQNSHHVASIKARDYGPEKVSEK